MKKLCTIAVAIILFAGCTKDDILIPMQEQIKPELAIQNSVGIKLETPFVSKEVSMNVKLEKEGTVVIKITDISNRVVSKEQVSVKAGDNILKVYTSALTSSSYRIGIYDPNNNLLGITDFNKIN